MLPAGRRLASAPGNPFPRPGDATLSVLGVPDCPDSIRVGLTSSQGIRALGAAGCASVRGRGLDCSATHADAWHHVCGGINMQSKPEIRNPKSEIRKQRSWDVRISNFEFRIWILGWLCLMTWRVPACADGGP